MSTICQQLLQVMTGPRASAILVMWLVLCDDHAGCLAHTSLARCGYFMWAGSRPMRNTFEKLWQSGLLTVSLRFMGHVNVFCIL